MDQELIQYFDERFDRIEHRLDGHDRLIESFNGRFDEVKRHTGVLVEGLRRELQLVAEGLLTRIDVRHAEDRVYVDQRFQETNALIRLSYETTDQLRQRVENLERKGQA
jgi:hypothetical protein